MDPENQNRELDVPTLCANNCGFFGSSATKNLCSKCYKDVFLSKSKSQIDTFIPPPPSPDAAKEITVEETAGGEGSDKAEGFIERGSGSGEAWAKKPSNRCGFCNKKVGLMGFKCRCGEVLCSAHRYSDKHNCVFDYREAGKDAIAKANPIVKADKVEKI